MTGHSSQCRLPSHCAVAKGATVHPERCRRPASTPVQDAPAGRCVWEAALRLPLLSASPQALFAPLSTMESNASGRDWPRLEWRLLRKKSKFMYRRFDTFLPASRRSEFSGWSPPLQPELDRRLTMHIIIVYHILYYVILYCLALGAAALCRWMQHSDSTKMHPARCGQWWTWVASGICACYAAQQQGISFTCLIRREYRYRHMYTYLYTNICIYMHTELCMCMYIHM